MIQKLIAPLWLLAFLGALFFFNDYELESFGVSALLVFVFSIVALSSKKEWHLPQSLMLLFMALFWLLAFISVLHTDILNTGIMAFVYFSALPLTFFVLVIKNDEALVNVIAKGGVVLFAALAVWALAQYFVFGEYFGGRAHHPLKNPNSLGALFSLILFASVGWGLIAKTKTQSNVALVLSVLLMGGIVATASRGVLFALIPVMGLMLFFMRGLVQKHWQRLSVLGVSALILFGLSVFGDQPQDTMMARVTDTLSMTVSDVSSNRTMLWLASIEMIKAHGLFGVGIGNYFQYFNEFRLPEDKWGTYYAHSDPLQYWVELGLLGPVLFYAFCVAVMVRTIKAVKKTDDQLIRAKILLPFFGLFAMIIHTHVTFNLYNLSILYVSGFMLAVWFMATQGVLKTPIKIIKFPRSYKAPSRVITISLPFIIIGFFFGAMMVSEHLTQRAKAHLRAGDLEQFGQTILTAQNVGLGHNYRADLLAANLAISFLSKAENFDQNFDQAQRRQIFNEGLFYLKRASLSNPRSASVQYYLGLIQEDAPRDFMPDGLKQPSEYYRHALQRDPLHFSARIAMANRLDNDAAIALLEAGIDYRYNNPQAVNYYMKLLSLYAQMGQAGKMKDISETIRDFQERVDRDIKKSNQSLF